MENVTITIENAEKVSHNISDLLCWWDGFSEALNLNDGNFYPVANHGIKELQDINIKIKQLLK